MTALISPWSPDTNVGNLRVLGKAIEERGESVQMLGRCVIQGIDESEPVTGKPNRQALEEELADERATAELLIEHFRLDRTRMEVRVMEKKARLRAWFAMMEPAA